MFGCACRVGVDSVQSMWLNPRLCVTRRCRTIIPAAERRNNVSHGRKPVELDPSVTQPRAKCKLDRAQPQEEGRYNTGLICVAPTGLVRNGNSKPRAHARG